MLRIPLFLIWILFILLISRNDYPKKKEVKSSELSSRDNQIQLGLDACSRIYWNIENSTILSLSNVSANKARRREGIPWIAFELNMKICEVSNWGKVRLRHNIADSIRTQDLSRKHEEGFVNIRGNLYCMINGQNITTRILINHGDWLYEQTL